MTAVPSTLNNHMIIPVQISIFCIHITKKKLESLKKTSIFEGQCPPKNKGLFQPKQGAPFGFQVSSQRAIPLPRRSRSRSRRVHPRSRTLSHLRRILYLSTILNYRMLYAMITNHKKLGYLGLTIWCCWWYS